MPPLNAVRAFEVAARLLSFNRAADELHVTPSAVSHQIRTLEEFLGCRLFDRRNRRVVLTPEGQDYLPSIRNALEQIHSATDRMLSAGSGGSLTISAAPSFAAGWLVPRLPAFQVAHPEIEIRLVTSLDLVDFRTTDVDLAVRFGRGSWPGLRSHRLMLEELVPVCSPRLASGPPPLREPADLDHARLLHVLAHMGEWRIWLRAAGVKRVDPERGPKFNTTPLALEAAIAGLGVAIADRRLVAGHLRAGRLVAPFDFELPSDSGYYLVYPEERTDNPKIAHFRDWILAEVASMDEAEAPAFNV